MQIPYRKPGKYSQIDQDPLMTEGKFRELEKKLERLKSGQPQAAKEVARLAEMGDFSENVEYQLAKGKLRAINQNIHNLERQISDAVIIESKKASKEVELGSTVSLDDGQSIKHYQILGSSETNPAKGIISHRSPIGSSLLGKKLGESVKIQIGQKEIHYTIVEIQ